MNLYFHGSRRWIAVSCQDFGVQRVGILSERADGSRKEMSRAHDRLPAHAHALDLLNLEVFDPDTAQRLLGAVVVGDHEEVVQLLGNPPLYTYDLSTYLSPAVENGHHAIVQTLLTDFRKRHLTHRHLFAFEPEWGRELENPDSLPDYVSLHTPPSGTFCLSVSSTQP